MNKLKELRLLGSDGKEYVVPIKDVDGVLIAELPKDWDEEKIQAYFDFMYHPNGYLTLTINEKL